MVSRSQIFPMSYWVAVRVEDLDFAAAHQVNAAGAAIFSWIAAHGGRF